MPCAQQILTMNIITTPGCSNHFSDYCHYCLSDVILGLAKKPELKKYPTELKQPRKTSLQSPYTLRLIST